MRGGSIFLCCSFLLASFSRAQQTLIELLRQERADLFVSRLPHSIYESLNEDLGKPHFSINYPEKMDNRLNEKVLVIGGSTEQLEKYCNLASSVFYLMENKRMSRAVWPESCESQVTTISSDWELFDRFCPRFKGSGNWDGTTEMTHLKNCPLPLTGTTVNVSIHGLPPYIIQTNDGFTGLELDIFKIMAAKGQFEFRLIKESIWGNLNKTTGQFNGVIGKVKLKWMKLLPFTIKLSFQVHSGTSQFGLGHIAITPDRVQYVSFGTSPFLLEVAIVSSFPKRQPASLNVLKPFSPIVWGCFGFSFLTLVFVVKGVNKLEWVDAMLFTIAGTFGECKSFVMDSMYCIFFVSSST